MSLGTPTEKTQSPLDLQPEPGTDKRSCLQDLNDQEVVYDIQRVTRVQPGRDKCVNDNFEIFSREKMFYFHNRSEEEEATLNNRVYMFVKL